MSVAFSSVQTKHSNVLNTNKTAIGTSSIQDFVSTAPMIDIHVSCKNLVKLDVGSQSDPMCVLMLKNEKGDWVEFDRTEVVWDDPNPKWVHFFRSLFIFETNQPIRLAIYDADNPKAVLNQHDFIGYAETDIQNLASNLSQELKFELQHPSGKADRGTLSIVPEQEDASSEFLKCSVQFSNLRKMNTFSKNNPYFVISKLSESGALLPIYRSEVINKCFSGHLQDFEVSLQTLCNGDRATPIALTFYNYSKKHSDEIIGTYQLSVNDFLEKLNQNIELELPKNAQSRKRVGAVKFTRLELFHKFTFLDYLRSGIQLNLITAVDFTASNRNPTDPRSLHHLDPNKMNSYEICINDVGSVICPYDTDQLFPCFGFGAKVNNQVSHCFPLTFDTNNPNCLGLQGILAAYRNSLNQVSLSGPTLFTPIIQSATTVAQYSFQNSKTYTILLILTDGIINDMRETIDSIVAATDAPLSIIIVGIGDADFSSMDTLDADDQSLKSSTGQYMKRDIVQFVPFKKFSSQGGIGLASEVLAEIPRQVHQYCKAHNYIPQLPNQ